MSHVFAQFNDGSFDIYEDVDVRWGDSHIMLMKDDDNYHWINLPYTVSLQISESPLHIVEFEEDEENVEEEDTPEDGS